MVFIFCFPIDIANRLTCNRHDKNSKDFPSRFLPFAGFSRRHVIHVRAFGTVSSGRRCFRSIYRKPANSSSSSWPGVSGHKLSQLFNIIDDFFLLFLTQPKRSFRKLVQIVQCSKRQRHKNLYILLVLLPGTPEEQLGKWGPHCLNI